MAGLSARVRPSALQGRNAVASAASFSTVVEDIAAARSIRNRWKLRPKLGVVLGSGLGHCLNNLDIDCCIPYSEIPGLAMATAIGHAGELVLGHLGKTPVAVLRGRVHVYEGHSLDQVSSGVRLLHALGCEALILSCAAGGLNLKLSEGQLMLIDDHIDMQWLESTHDMVGRGLQRAGTAPRSTSQELNSRLLAAARSRGVSLAQGVYVAVSGPNYETRAEQRFLATIADAVGMSTVPEIVTANRMGLPVAAVAMITNICNPDQPEKTSGEEVVAVASRAAPQFCELLTAMVDG